MIGIKRLRGPRDPGDTTHIEVAVPSAHSLGRLWWAASEYAGLPGHHAAGKTMALAAYGRPIYLDRFLRQSGSMPTAGFGSSRRRSTPICFARSRV